MATDERTQEADRPTGTVTFLFTDIERSTRLLKDVGHALYEELLLAHRRLLRDAVRETNGAVVDMQGDACLAVFRSGADAVAAAAAAQRSFARHPWPEGAAVRVRMGLHTGDALLGEEGTSDWRCTTARASRLPPTGARRSCRR